MKTITEKQINHTLLNALKGLSMEEELLQIDVNGQKFVVLKEEDYRGWRETAYLLSSSKNATVLQNAIQEPINECRDLKGVLNELEG